VARTPDLAQHGGQRPKGPSVFLFVILAAQLMVVLDSTIVNVALPHIETGLRFSASGLSWVLNAYILTFGGLLLLGARAGDILGRRRTFLAGIALFSLSSLAGGFAPTSWALLSARTVQGMGAALAAPSSLALLTSVFREGQQRMRAIGLFTTVSAAGGAIGLVAGGILTELVSWRWVMFVNVPIGLAVWVVGSRVIPETPRRQGRFDVAGAITSTAGMVGVVLGLVEAGQLGWSAPLTLGPLAAGAVLLCLFVQNERRAQEPVLPLRLLSHATRNGANLARALVYAGMFGTFFFLSQFLQDIQHYSPLVTGAAFLPVPVSVFASSQLTSRALAPRARPKVLMLTGASLSVLSLLIGSRTHVGTPYIQVFLVLVLLGTGSGMSLVSLTSASLAGVPPEDAGAASGLVNVAQQIGAALGLAVLVTVFGDATHHASFGKAVPATAAARVDALLAHGLHDTFLTGAMLGALALVTISLSVRPHKARAGTEVLTQARQAPHPVLVDLRSEGPRTGVASDATMA
jgi:EmrB/QacA subfamily drug resistance transporter